MAAPDLSERPWREGLRAVRARWRVVVVAAILVPVGALLASSTQTASYEATARLFPSQGNVPGDITARLHATFKAPDRAIKTQAELAHTLLLAKRVLASAPTPGVTPDALLANTSISANQGSDMLEFTVRSGTPKEARRLATEYAHQYTLYRRELDQIPIERALDNLRAASSGDVTGARDLETVEALNGAAPPVLSAADSASKVRPEVMRNVLAGVLLGALFGLGMALLWDSLDDRVRSSKEISAILGLRELARLPAREKPGTLQEMLSDPAGRTVERFLPLRTGLIDDGGGARTVMVTSPAAGEGAPLVAAQLAVALARTGHEVALASPDEAAPSDDRLRVVASAPDAALQEIRRTGALGIVAAPPLLGSSEGMALAREVDDILLVIRRDRLGQTKLAELQRTLSSIPVHKLGFVLTGERDAV